MAGCVNFDPVIDITEFHVIGSSSRTNVDSPSLRVAVRDVHLVDFLNNSQLVEREGPNEVRYLSQHRWAGSLESMISQVVCDELERSVSGLYATSGDSPEADINLDLHVLQFVRTSGGGVQVAVEYRAVDASTRELISEGRISKSTEGSSASVNRSVALLEEQLRAAVSEFAGKLD